MADFGTSSDSISEQTLQSLENQAANLGRKAAHGIGRKVRKATRGLVHKTVHKAGKVLVGAGKAFIQLILKFLAMLGPIGILILSLLVLLTGVFNFILDERGSNESNTLEPYYQNPSYVDTDGVTRALAMTEPQAVIDAYYKYMSCLSFSKTYDGKILKFQNEEQAQDFAGLRDYNKLENNFYLSDDFIRTLDEALHKEKFYYPEQVIKPVFGQKITLKDGSTCYVSRLPFDTPDGETMLDEKRVRGFANMLDEDTVLTAEGSVGTQKQLIAQSQTPTAVPGANEVLPNQTYYVLKDRNVIFNNDSIPKEAGLWDYGFGSVLQYQADQKISYITCSYDSVDVDFDYKKWEKIGTREDGSAIYGWGSSNHGKVLSMPVTGSVDELKTTCQSKCDSWSSSATK